MRKIELTILMPCLNEEVTVGICVKKAVNFMKNKNIVGEVLVVDNGSSDNSKQVALNAGARVVSTSLKGYGNALRFGIKHSKGEYIIYGDCDDSYDFSALDGYYSKLKEGYLLVNGNRYGGTYEKGAMSFSHRYIGVPLLSWLGRKRYHVSLFDFHCGLRGIKKIDNMKFTSTGMEFATEIIHRYSLLDKNKMIEIPINFYKDGRNGKSHLHTIRDGIRHIVYIYSNF